MDKLVYKLRHNLKLHYVRINEYRMQHTRYTYAATTRYILSSQENVSGTLKYDFVTP